MTRITLANTWTDPESGETYQHDDTIDVAPATARILISRGKARPALAAEESTDEQVAEEASSTLVDATSGEQLLEASDQPAPAAEPASAAPPAPAAELEQPSPITAEPTGPVEVAAPKRRSRAKEAGTAS
ncbi:hypothetical protein ACWGOE_07265 [Leucobacter chromiiresistens]